MDGQVDRTLVNVSPDSRDIVVEYLKRRVWRRRGVRVTISPSTEVVNMCLPGQSPTHVNLDCSCIFDRRIHPTEEARARERDLLMELFGAVAQCADEEQAEQLYNECCTPRMVHTQAQPIAIKTRPTFPAPEMWEDRPFQPIPRHPESVEDVPLPHLVPESEPGVSLGAEDVQISVSVGGTLLD